MNFLKQIDKTKIFMLWNGYPSYVCNSRIKLVRSNQCKNGTNKEGNNRKIIWLKFLNLRKKDQSLLSSFTRKKNMLKRSWKSYHLLRTEENNNVFLAMRQSEKNLS